jgi:Metallo-beta-lactamase superfamily
MTIPYVRDLDVRYGRVEQVSPLIRRVVADNPSKFTYLGTGTYIVGRGDVAVIDAGPRLDAHVDALVAALEPGERVTHLLVTHTHTDHSPATALMKERTGAPSYGFGPHGAVPPDDPNDRIVFGDPEARRSCARAPTRTSRPTSSSVTATSSPDRVGRSRPSTLRATRRTTCATPCTRSGRCSAATTSWAGPPR